MNEVKASYFFRPREGVSPEKAAKEISMERMPGKPTEFIPEARFRDFQGSVGDIQPAGEGYVVSIHFPSRIFEPGNIPQYFSVLAGRVFRLQKLELVRLLDVRLPDGLVPFHGPKFGISGIRHLLGTIDRPHIGTVVRPNIGLHPKEVAAVAYEAAIGGADFIMDDELLTNQEFCTIHDRVPEVKARLDEARSETGQKTIYAVNVTAFPDAVLDRATNAIDLGADMIMIHIGGPGYGSLKILCSEPGFRIPIHVHCTIRPDLTQATCGGVSLVPIVRLARMVGGDQCTIGSVNAGSNPRNEEVVLCRDALISPEFGHRRSLPVISRGIHPGNVAEEIGTLGKDVLVLAGYGVHTHPDGLAAGMKALRQAVDACMADIPVGTYAEEHYELQRALNFLKKT
jgi:ribulose-bisphosphate carboxylase large chain